MKTTFSDSLRGIEQSDIPWCLDPVLLQRHLPSLNLLYLNKIDLYYRTDYNTFITHRLNFILILFFGRLE